VAAALPRLELNASGMDLKAFEDMLDAIVCAWVAICTLEKRARRFGDDNSVIWIPNGAAAVSLKR
jgi:predicted RNase H-like nuclease